MSLSSQIWFWTTLFFLIFQLLLATPSYAESITPLRWKYPRQQAYEMAARGEDCSIFRTVRERASRDVQRFRGMQAQYSTALVQSRQALESCAKQKGIEEFDDEAEEVLVAEVCAPLYQAWLKPAARLELLEGDIRDAENTLDVMTQRLESYCGHADSSDES